MAIKIIFSTIKCHDLDLEKRATLFSYSRSVENILYFLLGEGLDIGMHYLPSRIQHALLEIQVFKQNKVIFFMDAQLKISCIVTS